MSYNGSGTFVINTSGQPVVAGTVISSTAFNALTADLATGLSTAITKDGQTTATARIPFAQGISSTLTTDSSSVSTGSIITAGGVGIAKALYVGTTANVASTTDSSSISTGSIVTAGGVGIAKNLYVGVNANVAGTLGVTGVATFSAAPIYSSLTASSAVATDASKGLVSVTNTGTGNNVLATSPTLVTPVLGAASATSITVAAGTVSDPAITTAGDTNTGIFFPAADTIAFAEGGAESMRIDSSGNVGIGTSSPSTQLQMNSGAATYSDQLRIRNTNFGNADIGVGSGIMAIATDMSNIAFYTSSNLGTTGSALPNNERMRIDSSGNVLIGKTASLAGGRVSIKPLANAHIGEWQVATDGYGNIMYNSAGTQVGAINIAVASVSYVTTSDYRLKEDVTPMTGALAKVAQLKPVTYKWKANGSDSQGFIAHELQAIVPECVTGEKDAVNEDGSINPQGIDTSFLVATLTAAIQEQQALIQSLTARITALEAK